MFRASSVCVAIVALSLTLAACGGDSSDNASAPPAGATGVTGPTAATGATAAPSQLPATGSAASTKAKLAYIARSDARCRSFDAGLDRATARARKLAAPGTPEGYKSAANSISGAVERAVAGAKELRKGAASLPADPNLTVYLNTFDQRLAVARISVTGLRRGNLPALEQLSQAEVALKKQAEAAARAYGFKACGRK